MLTKFKSLICLVGFGLASLILPFSASLSAPMSEPQLDTAVFAGGCFWGVDAVFKHVKGVHQVISGYTGGKTSDPSYEEVSTGTTGHAESVLVIFNPKKVSYDTLLHVFFTVAHNPTELNRQGPDKGTQYRSAIFYTNPEQHKSTQLKIEALKSSRSFSSPIVTEVSKFTHFYPAESYHQNYLNSHTNQPYIIFHDLPKLEMLKQKYPELYQ